jgi:hypothetical protein
MTMTRATSEQVEDVLQSLARYEQWDQSALAAICRDWIDMQARERRLVAVVGEVRQLRSECQVGGIKQDGLVQRLAALFGSLTDYDVATAEEATDD